MHHLSLEDKLHDQIIACTGASEILGIEPVQSLWSGYGQIVRLTLGFGQPEKKNQRRTVVVKHIQPPSQSNHPRGWNTDASTQRKLESYRVEANWYRQYAESCNVHCAMPRLLDSYQSTDQTWLILEDLDLHYPDRHNELSIEACKPCVQWLARFHGYHFQSPGEGLWPTGTYWHLQTRQDEFTAMVTGPLKDAAITLDTRLENCQFKTLVHGDAKVANICFSASGENIAMVDYQYVGRGCGIRDVVYFFSSALTEHECEHYADQLLDAYFKQLRAYLPASLHTAVETEWRALYAIAWADFHRFLAGWMPEHYKIHSYTQRMTQQALAEL